MTMPTYQGMDPLVQIFHRLIVYSFLATVILVISMCTTSSASQYKFNGYGQPFFRSQPTCPKEMYSVVFDAGSTGSRVFVFQFRMKDRWGKRHSVIKLNKEHFLSTEPGISSFAHNTSALSSILNPLVQYAERYVPGVYHNKTSPSFKATAGLRLLPQDIGDKILEEVRFLLIKSSFHIPDPQKIEVLGGDDEGLYGWVTVNFLLGTLWNVDNKPTAVAVDLGGGSVQITYALPASLDVDEMCSYGFGQVYRMQLLKSTFNVLTHSALGFGLKSAYLQIMGGQEEIEIEDQTGTEGDEDINSKDDSQEDEAEGKLLLVSSCFEPDFESTWQHGRYTYTIRGQDPVESRLEDCQGDVDKFVESLGVASALHLTDQTIYLFSYFFDVAQWTGIIPPDAMGMVLMTSNYYEAAEQHCQPENFSQERPFHCMSLLYIHSLLTKGLGLPKNRSLHVRHKLNGRQLSWTLGLALFSLNDQFSCSNVCSDTS